jgi:hypothetical protein
MLQERRGSDLRGILSNAKTRETARPPVGAICRPDHSMSLPSCSCISCGKSVGNSPERADTTTGNGGARSAPPLASPYFPPTLILPQITPLTSPAVISPQFQLDYNLQIPLFGELPLRKELSEEGIDFIAHYISQTASNTAGVHGTGTA